VVPEGPADAVDALSRVLTDDDADDELVARQRQVLRTSFDDVAQLHGEL